MPIKRWSHLMLKEVSWSVDGEHMSGRSRTGGTARLPRRLYLWGLGLALVVAPLEWFVDAQPIMHFSVPLRFAFMAFLWIGVASERLDQVRAERLLLGIGNVAMSIRVLSLGSQVPEQGAIELALSAPIMLTLTLLLAPPRSRQLWTLAMFVVSLGLGAYVIGLQDTRLYLTVVMFLVFQCVVLMILARHASEVEETSDLAFTDDMTGLHNRRSMQVQINASLARTDEHGWADALIMVDVDNFKQINDEHGHEEGDQVLRAVSTALNTTVRDQDAVGRWGGDEFLILLSRATRSQAKDLAERLRMAVRDATSVTVSLGVAVSRPGDTSSVWIRRCDQALYTSKEQGRDQVSMAPPTDDDTADAQAQQPTLEVINLPDGARVRQG